jgi:hypothetical protein
MNALEPAQPEGSSAGAQVEDLKDLKDPFGIIDGDPGNPSDLPPADEEERRILSDFDRAYEEASRQHLSRRGLIDYCTLMLKGETLVARTINNEFLRTVVEGNPQRPRSADNKMRVADRVFVSKLIKIIPSVRAKPRSVDRDDMIAASVMDSALEAAWQAQDMRLKYKRLVSWIPRAGMGIGQIVWNPQGGRRLAHCPECQTDFDPATGNDIGDPCPVCALRMQQQMQASAPPIQMRPMPAPAALEEVTEGDLELRVIDPREFVPDPGAVHPEEITYAFVSKTLPIPILRRMFPDKWQLIQPELGLYADKFFTTTYGDPFSWGHIERRLLHNHAKLDTLYEIPSGLHPKGRIISRCNGRVMQSLDNVPAYLLGRLQFFLFRGDVDDGELWPEPIIMQAEGLQRELDVLVTQKRQHRDLTINPPMLNPVNNGINANFLDRVPGKMVKYRAQAGKPEPMRTAQMPAYVEGENDRLVLSLYEKWGVTAFERGNYPSETSGRSAALLDTMAQAVVAGMLIEIYAEWLNLHRSWLILSQYYYAPDRVWTIYGADKTQLITRSWKDAKILPGWDVYVVEDDSLSRNPVMRLQQALDLKARAPELFMDQQTGRFDEKRFRLASGLKLESTAPDADTAEHIYAAKVPELIKDALRGHGPPPTPQPFDNPWIMLEEIKGWLQTQGRNLLTKDPELVQEVMKWWQYYVSAVMPADPSQMIDPMQARFLPMQQPGQKPAQTQAPAAAASAPAPRPATPVNSEPAAQEAQSKVQQADQQGERLARPGEKHEG